MDLDLVEFLFSVGFVIVGSIVFHISTLISGYSIYQEMKPVESSFLSLAVGILIFLFSPVVFIILFVDCVSSTFFINQILNKEVLVSFFSCAIGLGLIFGYLTILSPRNNLLEWFRQRSGIKFWIMSYGFAWDLLLASTKKGGKISVQTKDLGEQHGELSSYSIRKEPKQIVLDQPDGKLLLLEDNIKSVRIPERSFRKHYEHMNHVGQAFNLVMVAIGFFLLSYSAINTCEYYTSTTSDLLCFEHITNFTSINVTPSVNTHISVTENFTSTSPTTHLCCKLDYPTVVNISTYNNISSFNITIVRITETLDNITTFYVNAQNIFLLASVIILLLSVWIAGKDFQDWRSYLTICPEFVVISYILALLFLYMSRDAVREALHHALETLQISDEVIKHYLSDSYIMFIVLFSILIFGSFILLLGWLKDQVGNHWVYKKSSEYERRIKMKQLIREYNHKSKDTNDDWLTCIIKCEDKIKLPPSQYDSCLNRLIKQHFKNDTQKGNLYELAQGDWTGKMGNCDALSNTYLDIIDALNCKNELKLIYRSFSLIVLAIICGLYGQYIISLILLLILLDLIYRMVSVKPLEKVIDGIATDVYINFLFAHPYLTRSGDTGDSTECDIYEMLDKIIQSIYRNLCLNIDRKSSIEDVSSDSLNIFDKFVDYFIGKIIIDCLTSNMNKLKKNHQYMMREDVNILLIFRRILKDRICTCQSKNLTSKTLNTDRGN